MRPEEIEVLQRVERGAIIGLLSKTHFERVPKTLRIAKSLMWEGFIESAGEFGDCVKLTPAGRHVLSHLENQ